MIKRKSDQLAANLRTAKEQPSSQRTAEDLIVSQDGVGAVPATGILTSQPSSLGINSILDKAIPRNKLYIHFLVYDHEKKAYRASNATAIRLEFADNQSLLKIRDAIYNMLSQGI